MPQRGVLGVSQGPAGAAAALRMVALTRAAPSRTRQAALRRVAHVLDPRSTDREVNHRCVVALGFSSALVE